MITNRYNYPTPTIRDIKGKETQTRNNWTLMGTSLAESQTDSYFPTKWPNGYPKQKDVSDTHIQRRTITKINHDRRTALERSVKSISLVGGGGGGAGGGARRGGGGLNRFYVATRCKRHTLSKTNYNKNKPWQKNRLGILLVGGGGGGCLNRFYVATILAPYFCRGLDIFVQSA